MSESTNSPLLLDKMAERFRYFAGKIYADRSPLYTNLALRVAEDPELLRLAASAQEKAALPTCSSLPYICCCSKASTTSSQPSTPASTTPPSTTTTSTPTSAVSSSSTRERSARS